MVLVIDNYDSFTWNLVQYLGELGATVRVIRNDQETVEGVKAVCPDQILLSPGPGRPEGAGITLDVIRTLGPGIPILGVCLGHQAIGAAFGGAVVRAAVVVHGKTSTIEHDARGVFRGIRGPFVATRYHSLVIDPATVPETLEITARTREDGTIMGVRHKRHPIHGVQFHPESILTGEGHQILRNFIEGRLD